MSDALRPILGENGRLKKIFPHFISRDAQLRMAEAIQETIQASSTLVVEAGTGVGKTFAYLIPVLLHDKKAIISTGTKNLQDQLFQKDLPALRKILAIEKKIVLLKGRSNYVCLYRLDMPQHHHLFESKSLIKDFSIVGRWSKITKTGDISELDTFADDSSIWPHVVSTVDSCLGSDCEFYQQCFVVKARKEALTADIVVINHHLFFADMSLKEESLSKLLPDVGAVVFDEAHQLYESASSFLSERFSSRQFLLLLRDIQSEYAVLGSDHPDILRLTVSLKQEITNFRLLMGDSGARESWVDFVKKGRVLSSLSELCQQVNELSVCLSEQKQRSKGLESAWQRVHSMYRFLHDLHQSEQDDKNHNVVFWFESFSSSFLLYKTPIDFSEKLSDVWVGTIAWIYASATLDAGLGIDHFIQPLGIPAKKILFLESPYDYKKQARLYFPRYLPSVNHGDFVARWIEALLPVLEAAAGRSLLLFTSHRAMQQAYTMLHDLVVKKFTVLMQGQASKYALLEQFKRGHRTILLGTSSFWQGVDVQGAALCCVCIDKLPFASPGDPVVKARINAYKTSAHDAFYDYQLPQAVIMLKQGLGRLIRSETDKGVLVIGDLRMLTKNTASFFLKQCLEHYWFVINKRLLIFYLR
ncbi:MAG: ATP-dependent DNA helicase [Gammaproteobacteria bacterium]|nr:ATP-dependent DNA helicase [Gammaproteobacteria bacterium]